MIKSCRTNPKERSKLSLIPPDNCVDYYIQLLTEDCREFKTACGKDDFAMLKEDEIY